MARQRLALQPEITYVENTVSSIHLIHSNEQIRLKYNVLDYLGSFRPMGNVSRDMTLFKDDDGSGYLISEDVCIDLMIFSEVIR